MRQIRCDNLLPINEMGHHIETKHVCLQIVRRYHADEATAFLVEENGDFSAAFQILHKLSKEKLKQFLLKSHDPLGSDDDNAVQNSGMEIITCGD